MKVSEVMSKQVTYISPNTSVKNVSRIIFGYGINGVPVCKNRKVVGFITERDIMEKFYPSMKEFMENAVRGRDFELMEEKAAEIFRLRAKDIMNKNPVIIREDIPLLRAQSLMFLNKVGRLPVVDKRGNLVGIISKGDIFRAVVGHKIPVSGAEEYHDWLSRHYDLVVGWGERLGSEMPSLTSLFRSNKVKSILDIGCGTGEHDIALAKRDFHILGLEASRLMYEKASTKHKKQTKKVKQGVNFAHGDYIDLLEKQKAGSFQACIFMGNAFAHLPNYKEVLSSVSHILPAKNSLIVLQIANVKKILHANKRFQDINFAQLRQAVEQEYAFIEFYDPPRKRGGPYTLTMVILAFDGRKWKFRSMKNSISIVPLDQEKITRLLKKHGFKKISFYGSSFWGPLFKERFSPMTSDWLNVVAER